MEERDPMGRPVYMLVKVEEVKDRGGFHIVHCSNPFGSFTFVIEEDVPPIGTECELRMTWRDKQ